MGVNAEQPGHGPQGIGLILGTQKPPTDVSNLKVGENSDERTVVNETLLWAFVWLGLAVGFLAAEMLVAGSFYLIPFAVGGGAAAAASFVGAPLWASFPLFLVVSIGVFLYLRPYAERMDQNIPQVIGVGANRLIGDAGVITQSIMAGNGQKGLVLVGGEEWSAQVGSGLAAMEGESVRILEVRGTGLIVEPEITAKDAWK